MRNRGLMLLGVLAVLLALVLLFAAIGRPSPGAAPAVSLPPGQTPQPPPEEALLTAVMDHIGVTRWSEALGWYETQQEGMPGSDAGTDTPVWIGRSGDGPFHSLPVCVGLKSPVQRTLAQALEAGLSPCPVCWTVDAAE